jgi:hypothetical protein
MRRLASSWVVLGALCVVSSQALALSASSVDMCAAPKLKTDKWQSRSEVGGMTLLIPPGFVESGHSVFAETQDSHFYHNGEHRDIAVGSGRGPAFVSHSSDVTEEGECETVIAGRRVTITKYRWVNEDPLLSASGNAGSQFVAVARFYARGALREVFVAFSSNAPSDFNYFRGLFWTVNFVGVPGSDVASATTPATHVAENASPVAAPQQTATPASEAPAAAPSAACAAAPDLPILDAVLDSSTVRMLIAGAAPIPKGYEIMALQFAGTGELSGMSVAQSDMPEASQHELSAVVATNLKPHDAHGPPAFLLRIDSSDAGLRYTVLPMSGCPH